MSQKTNLTLQKFYDAICHSEIEKVRAFVADGVDVNGQPYLYDYAIPIAGARHGSLEIMEILIDAGARLNDKGYHTSKGADGIGYHPGLTPLIAATRNRMVDMVALLLAKGADVNLAKDDGMTPLMTAVMESEPALCELLLINGADITVENALAMSVARQYPDMMALLDHYRLLNAVKNAPGGASVEPITIPTRTRL